MNPVAILFRRMGPYHRARLNAAAARLPVVAVEATPVDHTYAWDAVATPELSRVTFFPDEDPDALPRPQLVQRVVQVLDGIQPRAVAIPGWYEPFALAALRWCGEAGVPAVLMSESQDGDDKRSWRGEAMKRRLVSLFSAALVGGTQHAAYLRQLGMAEDRIFLGYDVVDNSHFARGAEAARADAAGSRQRLGLPESYFLASSRFVEKKNLLRLVAAFARFRALAPQTPWKLVLLGDGPLRREIPALADKLSLGDSLLLPGFVQYEQLPGYYGLAAAFVHASTVEQWGLVVNEAMAAGLPVLVSKRCGCSADLVREGVNGFTFDPLDEEALASLLLQAASRGDDRLRMGEASRRAIAEWPPERFGAGMEGAVRRATPPRQPRLSDAALLRLLLMRPRYRFRS
ncbi:MAG: glycosyltransferase [Bryobacteraceae bacterium]|jgi:glycosyltransferase involved in cell wall biosynthesis